MSDPENDSYVNDENLGPETSPEDSEIFFDNPDKTAEEPNRCETSAKDRFLSTVTDIDEGIDPNAISATAKDRLFLATDSVCLLFSQTVVQSPMLTPTEENYDFLQGITSDNSVPKDDSSPENDAALEYENYEYVESDQSISDKFSQLKLDDSTDIKNQTQMFLELEKKSLSLEDDEPSTNKERNECDGEIPTVKITEVTPELEDKQIIDEDLTEVTPENLVDEEVLDDTIESEDIQEDSDVEKVINDSAENIFVDNDNKICDNQEYITNENYSESAQNYENDLIEDQVLIIENNFVNDEQIIDENKTNDSHLSEENDSNVRNRQIEHDDEIIENNLINEEINQESNRRNEDYYSPVETDEPESPGRKPDEKNVMSNKVSELMKTFSETTSETTRESFPTEELYKTDHNSLFETVSKTKEIFEKKTNDQDFVPKSYNLIKRLDYSPTKTDEVFDSYNSSVCDTNRFVSVFFN